MLMPENVSLTTVNPIKLFYRMIWCVFSPHLVMSNKQISYHVYMSYWLDLWAMNWSQEKLNSQITQRTRERAPTKKQMLQQVHLGKEKMFVHRSKWQKGYSCQQWLLWQQKDINWWWLKTKQRTSINVCWDIQQNPINCLGWFIWVSWDGPLQVCKRLTHSSPFSAWGWQSKATLSATSITHPTLQWICQQLCWAMGNVGTRVWQRRIELKKKDDLWFCWILKMFSVMLNHCSTIFKGQK